MLSVTRIGHSLGCHDLVIDYRAMDFEDLAMIFRGVPMEALSGGAYGELFLVKTSLALH